jgi:predicted SAM-dependent methyltransferase
VKLNIGCGRNILKDWINVDSVELPGVDIVANLETCGDHDRPLFTNIADNTVDEILCSHVLEHIRNILPLMQELWCAIWLQRRRMGRSDARTRFLLAIVRLFLPTLLLES